VVLQSLKVVLYFLLISVLVSVFFKVTMKLTILVFLLNISVFILNDLSVNLIILFLFLLS